MKTIVCRFVSSNFDTRPARLGKGVAKYQGYPSIDLSLYHRCPLSVCRLRDVVAGFAFGQKPGFCKISESELNIRKAGSMVQNLLTMAIIHDYYVSRLFLEQRVL